MKEAEHARVFTHSSHFIAFKNLKSYKARYMVRQTCVKSKLVRSPTETIFLSKLVLRSTDFVIPDNQVFQSLNFPGIKLCLNFFWPCSVLLYFLILPQILCPGFYTLYPVPFLLTSSSFWVLASYLQMSSIPLNLKSFLCFFFFCGMLVFYLELQPSLLVFHTHVFLM